MGAEDRCGRGAPQRTQEEGSKTQAKASTGLRRTRATARQREVSEGGTSLVSEPESLLKTHLTWGGGVNERRLAPSIPLIGLRFQGVSPCREKETSTFMQFSHLGKMNIKLAQPRG